MLLWLKKINKILQTRVAYVICVICISEKLKYLKNEARESKTERYLTVVLSVFPNTTNLILGFSSPLIKPCIWSSSKGPMITSTSLAKVWYTMLLHVTYPIGSPKYRFPTQWFGVGSQACAFFWKQFSRTRREIYIVRLRKK